MILHLLLDILRNTILITGLVTVMMMLIESLNIESGGSFFKGLKKTRTGQVMDDQFRSLDSHDDSIFRR